MRSLEDSSLRWQITVDHATGLDDLKGHINAWDDNNACTSGLRSVCWKTFLLFQSVDRSAWPSATKDSRDAYASLREHFLKYIEHPEELQTSLDPLDDDENSPWNILRRDEELRAEIVQDVERCMPEEPFFREATAQRMLLDILFIYCKMNQDTSYRQGMHELLAPILWVVEQDAIDPKEIPSGPTLAATDSIMVGTLDSNFIEHDAFTLFTIVMRTAKSFYELGEPERKTSITSSTSIPNGSSPIVERSKRIHEVLLARVDPELASHLTAIEVLPQIFLIRWVRLLFGREFPFDEVLTVWDKLFAEDPDLELVDMICVAMLLRIRWQLLESEYSVALTLLLKYPSPKSPHGPQTFVDDAIFLRDNPTRETGMNIIEGYSGRAPIMNPSHPRAMTPVSAKSMIAGQRPPSQKSPLASPARFLQQQGGVEALLQNAAKGVLQRGERLGINQAVRDAVGEVKKNMQNLSTGPSGLSRRPSDISRWSLDEGREVPSARKALAALEQRNKRLAGLLDDALQDLRKISLSNDDSEEKIETTELAIGKVQFVQLYLEDSSLPLPSDISQIPSASKAIHDISLTKTPSALVRPVQLSGDLQSNRANPVRLTSPSNATNPVTQSNPRSPVVPIRSLQYTTQPITRSQASIHQLLDVTGQNTTISERPSTLIPTRSSLAQSSFAWMLEPDEPSSSLSPAASTRSSPFASSGRKPGTGHNRDKTAFLFGDEPEGPDIDSRKSSTQVEAGTEFNLGTIKGKMG